MRLGAAAGLAGCSIEDSTGRPDDPLYEYELAVERIRAAAEATRALPFPFTLTARAENFVVRRKDLKDTIRRLQGYQEAGADVLYAPALTTSEDINAVVRAVDRPVNVLMALPAVRLTAAELSDIGVGRISIGSTLSRVAIGAFLNAAREMRDHGTFSFTDRAVTSRELSAIFASR